MCCTSSKVPDPNLPYTVVTDVSGTAAGGVLMQDQGEGLQPLAFLSRRLKPIEQRYSAYERERHTEQDEGTDHTPNSITPWLIV